MKTKKYYLYIRPWYLIVLLAVFYGITHFISENQLRKMPESKAETTLFRFNGKFPETGYSYVFFYDGNSKLCNKMRYSVEQFVEKNDEAIHFFEIDINEAPEYYRKFNVFGVPNLLIFKDNKELTRIMGIVSESNLHRAQKLI